MQNYTNVVGIAWDDEPEYFQRVLSKLGKTTVSYSITASEKEFRERIEQSSYDFALLDIFEVNYPVYGQAEPKGLRLCLDLRNKHPDMPIILATSLYNTIDRTTRATWDLGADTYLWSKQLREHWFAQDLLLVLEHHGLLVHKDSLLVLGELSDGARHELDDRLKKIGVSATFESYLDANTGWATQAAQIQSYAAFLIVANEGERDAVALDIGRILAMPRAKQRLIVACKADEFPWLDASRLGNTGGIKIIRETDFEVTNGLLTQIKSLMP